jgi:hypothetical protein
MSRNETSPRPPGGGRGGSGTSVAMAPSLSIARLVASAAEGNSGSTPFTFAVTRAGVTTGASSAHWAVIGSGGASANAADFTGGVLPSGIVSFAAGGTSKTITVNAIAFTPECATTLR